MDDMLAVGRRILDRQGFSRLLKADLTVWSAEMTELRVPIGADTSQQTGIAHGGVICYAADNALTYAGGAALDGPVVTAEMKINYIRPAVGSALVARATALHAGRTQAVVRCDVYDVADGGTEKLCATALGTIRKVAARPPEGESTA